MCLPNSGLAQDGRPPTVQSTLDDFQPAFRRSEEWLFLLEGLARVLATHEDRRVRDPREAQRICEEMLRRPVTERVAWQQLLADSLAQQGRFAEASEYLRKLNLPSEADRAAIAHRQQQYRQGIAPVSAGTIPYTTEQKNEPNDRLSYIYTLVGDELMRGGHQDAAVASYAMALQLRAANREAAHALVAFDVQQGNWQRARQTLETVCRVRGDDLQLLANLGTVYKMLGLRSEAAEVYRHIHSQQPDWHVVSNSLAWLLATSPKDRADANEAVRIAERVCAALGQKDPAALDTLATAYAASGKFGRARETIGLAIDTATQASTDQETLSRYRVRQQLYAIEKPFRSLAEAHAELGQVHMAAGREDEALSHFTEALNLGLDEPRLLVNLGTILKRRGLVRQTHEFYTSALQRRPDWGQISNAVAWQLATHTDDSYRNGAQALMFARQAYRTDPKPEYLDTMAAALAEMGHFQHAVNTLDKAIKDLSQQSPIDRERLDDYRQRQQLYARQQPFRNAYLMHLELAAAEAERDDFAAAIEHLQAALGKIPQDPVALANLGTIFKQQGRLAEALEAYELALEQHADWNDVENSMAWILATAEDTEIRDPRKAVEHASRVCRRTNHERPRYLDTLATACAACGQLQRAVEHAEQAWQLATDQQEPELAERLQQKLRQHRQTLAASR